MFTILSRIIHFGLVSFWRNGWLSTATVAIMVVALSMLLGLNLFGFVTDEAVASLQDKIDISVYFKSNTPEDQILAIKRSLESLSEVKSVDYISRDKALEIFKERHKDEGTISQAINELQENPLQASLEVKAKDPRDYASLAEYFSDSPNLSQYIESVSYSKNRVVIERLNAIIRNVTSGGLLLTVVLAFVAALVIFNTIRLAIYSNREEIGIMRLVGASNALVRGPYVVEGIVGGIIAAVVSIIVAVPIVYALSPHMDKFVPSLNLFAYFYTHIVSLFWYQLLLGILLGGLSSFWAVRRYLKH
jgi:cell division transport system permease protein